MLCAGCSQHLDEAANAICAHATVMRQAIDLIRDGSVTEEYGQDFTIRLRSSFIDAQSAWDAYRQHLIEHGYLPKVA